LENPADLSTCRIKKAKNGTGCGQVSISSTIFVHFFCTNVLFGSFSSYVLALAPKFRTKNVRVNVDEIDGRIVYFPLFMPGKYTAEK
jgi:hypothetical protein